MTEVWLTEPYYADFVARRETIFSNEEAIQIYAQTQLLRKMWPRCISNPPPEVGAKFGLFYVKHNWTACRLRICFGALTESGVQKIVALSCRSKQELSKGNSNGTREWYRHMSMEGIDRWDDYRRDLIPHWKIY